MPPDEIARRLEDLSALLGPLPDARLPIVLLPAQIETRFVLRDGRTVLLVRFRPDAVAVDAHEPELTAGEVTWGRHYWENVWRTGDDTARREAAWSQLVGRLGEARAGWVERALRPLNLAERPTAATPDGAEPPTRPRFPDVLTKSGSWTRPAVLPALPDRWVLFGYRGGQRVFVHWSEPTAGPLAVSVGPDEGEPSSADDAPDDELLLDDSLRWLVEFSEAERVGMALRVPVTVDEAQIGFDRLCVIGLRAADPEASAVALEQLLLAQRFTDGLAFVTPGTPTNNTLETEVLRANSRSPISVLNASDTNTATLAHALGIDPDVFHGAPRAAESDELDARHMNTLLWPATGGYFLEQIMAGSGFPVAAARPFPRAHQHFRQYVRAAGPLPLIRVGRQPYGLLPVTAHGRALHKDSGERLFLDALAALRGVWQAALPHIPQALPQEGSTEIERDLLDILRMSAHSVGYHGRLVFDKELFGSQQVPLSGNGPPAEIDRLGRMRLILEAWREQGFTWRSRLLETFPAQTSFSLNAPLVQAGAAAGPLDPNYVAWLGQASFADIAAESYRPLLPIDGKINTLLYLILRHAVLLTYAQVARRILIATGSLPDEPFPEPILVDVVFDGTPRPTPTLLRLLDQAAPGLGDTPLSRIIHTLGAAQHPEAADLDEMRAALAYLASRPVEVLENLLRGGLDLFIYRLDAWLTAMATRRLAQLREATPRGLVLGSYGWVEGVRAAPRVPVVAPPPDEGGAPLFEATDSGGYFHAPSLAQATAGAILRSGFLSETGEGGAQTLAVDLSSERVRLAQWLLDGVREGQPVAALLGYRLERGLHDRQLDEYIAPFRRVAPFGEISKAQAALEAAEEEARRLEVLGNPALNAARQRVDQLTRRLAALRQEKDSLPSRLSGVNSRLRSLDATIAEKNRTLGELHRKGLEDTPAYQRLEREIIELRQQRAEVAAQSAALTNRQTTIDGEIQQVSRDLTGAEAELRQLEGSSHPDLQRALEEERQARERLETLLEERRQRFLLASSADVTAMESLAEIDVVDGLALLALFQTNEIPFGRPDKGLPAVGSADHAAIISELQRLAAAVDAVADALTAESVYQIAQGNPARAGATLDAVVQGDLPPPELEVVRTPRTGIGLTHRLLLLLNGAAGPPPAWPINDRQMCAPAEPRLNAWAARLLGDPARVRCRVEFLDPQSGALLKAQDARLRGMGLSPLDVIYLSAADASAETSELERLLEFHQRRALPANVPPEAVVRLRFEREANWAADELDFGELLEIARALRELILGARPAIAQDLAHPSRIAPVSADLDELRGRADAAATALRDIHDRLARLVGRIADTATAEQLDNVRGLLLRALHLRLPHAVPVAAVGSGLREHEALLAQAQGVVKAAARRLGELATAEKAFDRRAAAPQATADHDLERLQTVFGGGFRALPLLRPANAAELDATFRASVALQGGQPQEAATWFDRVARVRPAAARLKTTLTYAAALNVAEAMNLSVGQLPHREDDRWVALPARPDRPIRAGAVSLVAHLPDGFAPEAPLAGLLVDEWAEVVPSATEATGVGFHFDAPAGRPPQAILVAVSPAGSIDVPWDIEMLEATVLETLELAKLRAVDPEALRGNQTLAYLLPALYFALNLSDDTVSTDFYRAA